MARMYIIIDGYNLLHAAGLGRRRYGPGELERARQRLVGVLQQHLGAEILSDTTVVFDAPSRQEQDGVQEVAGAVRMERSGLTIRYSTGGRDADAEIEQMLGGHSSPGQVLVVSGDHRLHKAAGGRRATCLDSEKFLQLLESANVGAALRGLRGVRRSGMKRGPERHAVAGDKQWLVDNLRGTGCEEAGNMADVEQEFLQIDVDGLQRSLGRAGKSSGRRKNR